MSSPFQVTHISHIYIKVYVSEQLSFLTHFFTFTKIEAVCNSQKSEVSTVMIWCCALTKAHHWVIMSCCFWVPPKDEPNFSLWLYEMRGKMYYVCVSECVCLYAFVHVCVGGWVGARGSCWSVQPRENYGPPEGDERGQQGTGDSQSLPDLLTPTHKQQIYTHTHKEREREGERLIMGLSAMSHLNRGGCPHHKA